MNRIIYIHIVEQFSFEPMLPYVSDEVRVYYNGRDEKVREEFDLLEMHVKLSVCVGLTHIEHVAVYSLRLGVQLRFWPYKCSSRHSSGSDFFVKGH